MSIAGHDSYFIIKLANNDFRQHSYCTYSPRLLGFYYYATILFASDIIILILCKDGPTPFVVNSSTCLRLSNTRYLQF